MDAHVLSAVKTGARGENSERLGAERLLEVDDEGENEVPYVPARQEFFGPEVKATIVRLNSHMKEEDAVLDIAHSRSTASHLYVALCCTIGSLVWLALSLALVLYLFSKAKDHGARHAPWALVSIPPLIFVEIYIIITAISECRWCYRYYLYIRGASEMENTGQEDPV